MPDTKLTQESAPSTHSARVTALKDKAPPKPSRRLSSIPPALVVSATASRIPPAPRPPRPSTQAQQSVDGGPTSVRSSRSRSLNSRPRSSRPQTSPPKSSWAIDDASNDRHTERPVAVAATRPESQRDAVSALVGVSLTALLLGAWWFVREPAPTQEPAPTAVAVRNQSLPSPQTTPVPKTARDLKPSAPPAGVDVAATRG